MKNIFKISTISAVTAILLVGCGSSDSSSSSNTGYFVDAPVAGCEYNTSSGISGVTGEYGKFKYNVGDEVTLKLGKLVLGTSEPGTNDIITPKSLITGDPADTILDINESEKLTLLLQTLQSLDSDGNASNGILIESDVIEALYDLNETIHIHDLNESELLQLDTEHDLGLDEDYDGHLDINATEATEHFENEMQEYEYGARPDDDEHKGKYQNNKIEIDENSSNLGKFDISSYSVTENLTQELRDALAHMGNEERLAYDIYTNLYNYHIENNSLDIKQLTNIATKSEASHVAIVQSVVQRYDIHSTSITDINTTVVDDNNISNTITFDNMPSGVYDIDAIQELYNTLYDIGITDKESALKVGCMVEVTDINDLDNYITKAEDSNATDIVAAFTTLRDASYSHYWAFDKGLKNIGITNGCYYDGDDLLGENKIGIYPQNENGSGSH